MTAARDVWKVGELATATGLTVRTLHHYEEIGLLRASERTYANHRLYTDEDIQRLYRILALKGLGLSLDEIRAHLDAEDLDPRETLRRHLAQLEAQARHVQQLHRQIEGISRLLERREAPTGADLVHVMEMMRRIDSYYSDEERAWLEARAAEIGQDAIVAAEREWAETLARAEDLAAADCDPTDQEVQALIDRWDELVAAFHGGHGGVAKSLQRMWEEQGHELLETLDSPLSSRGQALVERARAVRDT